MFCLVWRALSGVRAVTPRLRKLGLRVFLALTAVQAALVGILAAIAEIRKRRHGPSGGFPWVDQLEVELESGDTRLKLYP
jgi:hypothetical protein